MFVQFSVVTYVVWHIILVLARSLVFINQKTEVLVGSHNLISKCSQVIVLGTSTSSAHSDTSTAYLYDSINS